MLIRKNLTNDLIYFYAENLINLSKELINKNLPVKVHFYFQKNMDELISMAKNIEESRLNIMKKYGNINNDTGKYEFDKNKIDIINKDIQELFALEQEVKIYMIPMKWIENLEISTKQFNAISFMLELEEEG